MKKYHIYTTNKTDALVIETEEDLFDKYVHAMDNNQPTMFIRYEKDFDKLGLYTYDVLLNTHQIVSIREEKKKKIVLVEIINKSCYT